MKKDLVIVFPNVEVFQKVIIGCSTLEFSIGLGVVVHGLEDYKQAFSRLCLRVAQRSKNDNEILKITPNTNQPDLLCPFKPILKVDSVNTSILKSGYLFKRRDVVKGWKTRYFRLFPNELHYYEDDNTLKENGIFILDKAELEPITRVPGKRHRLSHERWGFSLKAHYIKKKNPIEISAEQITIRIASTASGMANKRETQSWWEILKQSIDKINNKNNIIDVVAKEFKNNYENISDDSLDSHSKSSFINSKISSLSNKVNDRLIRSMKVSREALESLNVLNTHKNSFKLVNEKSIKQEINKSIQIRFALFLLTILIVLFYIYYKWAIEKSISKELYITLVIGIIGVCYFFIVDFMIPFYIVKEKKKIAKNEDDNEESVHDDDSDLSDQSELME